MQFFAQFNPIRKMHHKVGKLSTVDTESPKSFLIALKCFSKVIDYGNNQSCSSQEIYLQPTIVESAAALTLRTLLLRLWEPAKLLSDPLMES